MSLSDEDALAELEALPVAEMPPAGAGMSDEDALAELEALESVDPIYDEGYSPQNPLKEQHPEAPRFAAMNLTTGPEAAIRTLQEQGFEVHHRGGYDFSVRKPGEKWRQVDPKGLDWGDPLDLIGDAVNTAGSIAGTVFGTAAGAPTGPGALATGAAGGAAGGASLAALRPSCGLHL